MEIRQFLKVKILSLSARARRLASIDYKSVGIRPGDPLCHRRPGSRCTMASLRLLACLPPVSCPDAEDRSDSASFTGRQSRRP